MGYDLPTTAREGELRVLLPRGVDRGNTRSDENPGNVMHFQPRLSHGHSRLNIAAITLVTNDR